MQNIYIHSFVVFLLACPRAEDKILCNKKTLIELRTLVPSTLCLCGVRNLRVPIKRILSFIGHNERWLCLEALQQTFWRSAILSSTRPQQQPVVDIPMSAVGCCGGYTHHDTSSQSMCARRSNHDRNDSSGGAEEHSKEITQPDFTRLSVPVDLV